MILFQVTSPLEFYVFDTEVEAETAQGTIYQAYVAAGFQDVNAATGEPVNPQITTRWDIPRERLDGKWVIAVSAHFPLEAPKELQADGWFEEVEYPL